MIGRNRQEQIPSQTIPPKWTLLSFDLPFRPHPYTYRPLGPGEIRLLRLLPPRGKVKDSIKPELRCELLHVSGDNPGKYEALSYVWGNPIRTHEIIIQTSPFKRHYLEITPNLYAALRRLQYKDKPRLLWIDQLCIDQESNSREKADQILRMRSIYERATRTVVWLGEKEDDTDLLRIMYAKLSVLPADIAHPWRVRMLDQRALGQMIGTARGFRDDEMAAHRRDLILRFLELPWFRRAWVYQEAVVAAEVTMVWGDLVLPFDFVTGLVVSIFSIAKWQEHRGLYRALKEARGFAPLSAIFYDRASLKDRKLDFLNTLWHARRHLEASDHRDLVYAFREFYNSEDTASAQIIPNYTVNVGEEGYKEAVEDAYIDLARTVSSASRSLDILQFVVPTLPSTYDLPSWVPNWANRTFTCGSPFLTPGLPYKFSACDHKPHVPIQSEEREFHVRGHIIGNVSSIFKHDFDHAYFSSSLKKVFQLQRLQEALQKRLDAAIQDGILQEPPDWAATDSRGTILRTILTDGSFTLETEISHPMEELLEEYDKEVLLDSDSDNKLRQYLRQTGEIASGKRLFLTDRFDLGLGFSTLQKTDIVCILYGSKAPCVLRKSRKHDTCTFIGHCYLHGWKDGGANPKALELWNKRPEMFVLV